MAKFAIILVEEHSELSTKIREEYPDCQEISPTAYLVEADSLSEGIASQVGIKGDNRIDGASAVVFGLDGFYSGYAPGTIWEWFARHGS